MKPASSAAPMAASSRRIASTASERRAMKASPASMARAAMATPSMTAYGSVSSSVRSVRTAGSAPYPFATTYRRGASAAAGSPFLAGREARPAATAEAGGGDHGDDRVRAEVVERLAK